jgi:hypothetical protein
LTGYLQTVRKRKELFPGDSRPAWAGFNRFKDGNSILAKKLQKGNVSYIASSVRIVTSRLSLKIWEC